MISALVSSQEHIDDMNDESRGGGLGFPSITWAGKVPGQGGQGVFIITADQIEGKYDESVLSDWDYGPVFLGGERKDAYYTSDMVCVPIAWRTCWVKHDSNRRVVGRWGKYTKRTPEMGGSKTNTQVIVYLPSLKDYALLGLGGVSKTVAWDNDQKNSRYASYPLGIQQVLTSVAQAASDALTEQHGSTVRVAPNLTFMVTLTNFLGDDGEPHIFTVGSTTTSQMFIPTTYANPDEWEKLYVGDGMFNEFLNKYIESFKGWVAEWPSSGAIGDNQKTEAPAVAQAVEDEDVPF